MKHCVFTQPGSLADVTLLNFDVRFTPNSGHSPTRSRCLLWAKSSLMHCSKKSLFDHLVGGRKQRRRNGQTEHFRGLEING